MNPLWSAGAAAIPSIFSIVAGAKQANKGKKLAASNVRPVYKRPSEVSNALALSESNYLNGVMPGTAQLKSEIGSSNANALDMAIQAATSGNDVLDAITKLNYNEQQQLNQVATQQAAYKEQSLQNYQNQLNNSAQYTDKEFGYNQDQPYQDRAQEASAMIEAGNQNVASGLNGISSLATTATMGGLFDGKKNPSTTPYNFNKFGSDAAIPAGWNFTNKKMVYNPYDKRLIASN